MKRFGLYRRGELQRARKGFIMIIQRKIDIDSPLTAAQEKMLRELASRPAVTDDDFPELTQEQLSQFRRISTERCDGAESNPLMP